MLAKEVTSKNTVDTCQNFKQIICQWPVIITDFRTRFDANRIQIQCFLSPGSNNF